MIAIAGDSWGEGKFLDIPEGKPGPRWPGFHYYWLLNGVTQIVNVSRGGYSNHQAVSALEMHLCNRNYTPVDTVVIWLTCVLRDYPTKSDIKDIDGWTQRHYQNIFDRLIAIAQNNNCKIHILGGLGDIPTSFPAQLSPEVSIMLHSTAKYMNPEYNLESPYGHFTLVENIHDIDQRHQTFLALEKKFNYMQSRRDIYADGVHFGAMAYQRIFNYVQSKI